MALPPGTTIAGYRVDGVLGRGGMGTVYEATQLALDRVVALKLLTAELGDDEAFATRLRQEARVQARVDHPNIVGIYEAGESDAGYFIAMRLVRGPRLKDLIVSGEAGPRRMVDVLAQVAEALDAAHTSGLVHRDVKPQNVLLDARDHAYLTDFGLTIAVAGGRGLTRTGEFIGTIDYISPEQLRGEQATPASDLYAFAAVLYECLTGIVPFPKDLHAAVLMAHLQDPVPRVTSVRGDLPEALDGIVGRGMAKDPADRPATVSELVADARRALAGWEAAPAAAPEVPPEQERPVGETIVSPTLGRAAAPGETVIGELPDPPPPAAPPLEETAAGETVVSPAPGSTTTSRRPDASPAETVTSRRPEGTEPRETVVSARQRAEPEPAVTSRRPKTLPRATLGARARPPRGAGRPRRGPAGGRVLAGLGAAVVLCALLGFLIGGRGGDQTPDPAPPGARTLASGPLEVALPAGWRRADEGLRVDALGLREPSAAGPAGQPGVGVVAGVAPETGPSLLTDAELAAGTPFERVRLGRVEALRYPALRLDGTDEPVTVHAIPIERGSATVACVGASGRPALARQCDAVAASARLRGIEPLRPNADAGYEQTLGRSLGPARTAVRSAGAALRRSRTARAQVRPARALARTYASAADRLDGVTEHPSFAQGNAQLVRALRSASRAYAALATAAGRSNRGRHARARTAARRAEVAVGDAVAAIAPAR